jgi:hypothetical protein
MSDDPQHPTEPDPKPAGSLPFDLDFTPDWARKDPGITANVRPQRRDWGDRTDDRDRERTRRPRPGGGGGGERRDDSRRDRPAERARPAGERPAADRPAGGGDGSARPARPRPGGREGGGRPSDRPAFRPRLPVRVEFIPQRDKLFKVVNLAKAAQKAYPLQQLAAQFMGHPESVLVKLTVAPNAPPDARLHYVRPSGPVFLHRLDLETWVLTHKLAERFESAEVELEAPTGQFPVIARCSLGGEWIGPPNHHEYRERLEALRAEKYPHHSPDSLARHLEMVREPEAVESWREAQRRQTRYGVKGAETRDLTRKQAEDLFRTRHLAEFTGEGVRCIATLTGLLEHSDPALVELVRHMMERERAHPFSILHALRPAFRQAGLHLFRARETQFVTHVPPHPLPAGTSIVAELGELLAFVQERPGVPLEHLLARFAPGAAMDAPEALKVRTNLRWLVEKGHVIQFHDNTLEVPKAEATRPEPAGGETPPESPAAPEEAAIAEVEPPVAAEESTAPTAEVPKADRPDPA